MVQHINALCPFASPWRALPIRRWMHWTYILDWALVFILWVFLAILRGSSDPFTRYNPKPNENVDAAYELDFADKKQTIPDWAVFVSCVVMPMVMFICLQVLFQSLHDLHHSILGMVEALTLLAWPVILLKLQCGRERPTFYVDQENNQDYSRTSFPSSPAAIAWCGCTYLSLYLMGKFGLFRQFKNGGGDGQFWKAIFCLLPEILALSISSQETRDYMAHFSDINMGILLGVSCAMLGYFMNYPSLFSERSSLPCARNFDVIDDEFRQGEA